MSSMEQHLQQNEADHSASAASTVESLQTPVSENAIVADISPDLLPAEHEKQGEDLDAALSQESRQFRRTGVRCITGVTLIALLLIAGRFLLGEERWSALLTQQAVFAGTLSVGLFLALYIAFSARMPGRRRREMTAQVAAQDDIRSIGALIDALHLEDAETRNIAMDALIKLLPRLTAQDAALLSDTNRIKLCFLLSVPLESPINKPLRALHQPANERSVAFRIAILRAFAQVGDRKALRFVERVAKNDPKSEGERRVQDAALACLPALRRRAEQEGQRQTLLRPAQSASNEEDTLLRPASGGQDTAPETLLRPSQPDK